MKVINLDELELKCIEWGVKSKLFTEDDLKKENLFTISLVGRHKDKSCSIMFKGLYFPRSAGLQNEIKFHAEEWEDLYYKINDFFRNSWDYTNPVNMQKAPLYMQITEELKKKSINNVVKLSDVHKVLTEKL